MTLLEGSPPLALLRLALPLLATGALNLASLLGDRLWVGRLGREALASLAGAHAVWMLLFTLTLGLSLATLAGVARAKGAGESSVAARVTGQGLLLALLLGGVAVALAWPLAQSAQTFLAPDPRVAAGGSRYLGVILAGALVQAPLTVALFALQAAGEGRAALRVGAVYPLGNLILTPLALALGGGLLGVALATVAANAFALALALPVLRRALDLRFADLRPAPLYLAELLSLAGPRSLEHLVRNGAALVVVACLARFGSAALAGYAAGLGLLLLLIHPGIALGQAAAACVGQSLGAGRPERAWLSAWWAVGIYAGFMAAAGAGLHLAAEPLVALFDPDPASVRAGALLLRTLAPALPLLAAGLVLGKACGGARRPGLPLLAVVVGQVFVQLPAVVLLGRQGLAGAFLGVALGYAVQGALACALFARALRPTSSTSLPALRPAGADS